MTDPEGSDDVRYYEAPGMTVEWRASRCQHSGNCVRALSNVFQPKRRPWIIIGDTSPEILDAAIQRCPSGALRFVAHSPAAPQDLENG